MTRCIWPTLKESEQMTLFISRNNIATPKKSQLQITNYISRAVKEAVEDGIKKKDIIIITDENNLYHDACTARYHQVKMKLGNKKISLGSTALTKSLFIFNLATRNEDIKNEKGRAFKACMKALTKMPFESLGLIIKEKLTGCSSHQFIAELQVYLAKEKAKVIKSVSISRNNKKVKFVNVDYKDNLNYLVTRPGIHLFIGDRGTGKSELLLRLFREACLDRRYPIYMSASRVLTEQLIGNDDVRNYKFAYADSFARGALGVMLTLMLNENYQILRSKSETLIIDEIEDVCDLSTAEIVGNGTLEDKKRLLQQWEEQIKKSTSVIAADAFTCDETVDWLYELAEKSGKTIYVYPQESQFKKPVVKIMPYATNIALSRKSSINGEKFGCFTDSQHNKDKSKFDTEIIAINGIKKDKPEDEQKYIGKHVQIDAAFMHSDQAIQLNDISKLTSKAQIIFYNPAAKNGLSILDPNYKRVSVLGHGTTAPNDFVQADSRFRFREEICLSFNKPERNLCTNPVSILTSMINKEFSDELTQEMLNEMLNDVYLKRIAKRIAFKNMMRENYEFTVFTIYQHLGHTIEFINDKNANTEGSQNLQMGAEEERATRNKETIAAEKIYEVEATSIMAMGEHVSLENKRKLRSYELRDFYQVPTVTQELIDFDKDDQSARILRTLLLIEDTGRKLTIDQQFKQLLIRRFVDVVKLHDADFRYNNIDAKDLHHFLHNRNITVGCQTRPAKEVFTDTFRLATLSKKYIISTINSVLEKELGIVPQKAKKKDGQRAFTANLSSEMTMWLTHIKHERAAISHSLAA